MIKKETSYRKCWDEKDWYGWAVSQKLPVDGSKWIENRFQFNKDFIKNYNDDSDIEYFLGNDVQYLKNNKDLKSGTICRKLSR